MLAEYIGKDGAMGFRQGQTYNIVFEHSDEDTQWFVRTSTNKIGVYSNEASMLKSWRPIGGTK